MVNGNTFNTPFSISAPCDDLISDIAFAIDYDHWDSGIWEVGYAFIANDGDEFRPWMPGGESTDVLKCTIAVWYTK